MGKAKQIVTTLYQQALKNQHCDVKITAHGKVYGAHRGVLVQASPYFEKIFNGSFKECHTGEISFTEITNDTDIVEAIMRYIYLGIFDMEAFAAEDVLQVASSLLLDELVNTCQQVLLEQLTLDNVLHTWSWAHLYNLKPLEEVCKALCRSCFHDTIIHQSDTMNLPVDFLCHIIKEGVLAFVDETAKLMFLQTWLQEFTRKCLMDSEGIIAKVSNELKEVEPNLSTALQESDFLNECFECMDTDRESVDGILSLDGPDFEKNIVSICDLKTGKWYESSIITPPKGFSRYLAVADQFIILQNNEKDMLYVFDNVTKKGTGIFIPTYSFDGSVHIFVLNRTVYLFVAMSDWANPSMDESGRKTTEKVKREANCEGGPSHDKSPDEGHTRSMYTSEEGAFVGTYYENQKGTPGKCDESSMLSLGDMHSLERLPFEPLLHGFEENRNDLTLHRNLGIKHCLFRLHTRCSCEEDKGSLIVCSKCKLCVKECPCEARPRSITDPPPALVYTCQRCRPGWELVCEVEGIGPNLILDKYESREIGGRFWIMAYGTTKNCNNAEGSEVEGGEEKKGPFWFCVETVSDTNQGVRVVRLPDPPERRTQRSRGVDWSQIKLVEIKVCCGLHASKASVRYSIYFDACAWRWKWVSNKTDFDVGEDNPKRPDPTCIELQIRPKKDWNYSKYGLHFPIRLGADKHDHSVVSYCDYPHINQFWSYESEEEGWRELHPPPCGLGCSQWQKIRISKSLLQSLDRIKPRMAVIDGKRIDSEDDEGPFANYEFVVEKL